MAQIPDEPSNLSEALLIVAEFLDLGDQAFQKLAEMQDIDLPVGDQIQRDLRFMAHTVEEHPHMTASDLWRVLVASK